MRGLMPARITLGTALLVVLAGCKSTARTGELEAANAAKRLVLPSTPPP